MTGRQIMGRSTSPGDTGQGQVKTRSGSRGLLQYEPLIFETGRADQTGVDLPDPKGRADRLGGIIRKKTTGLPGLCEPETVRHYMRLSQRNYAIDLGLFPLGSCTMKHNPRLNEKTARMAGFADIGFYYATTSDDGAAEDPSWMAFNINNIAADVLMGIDLDVEYATYDADAGGEDGTLTSVSLGYTLDQFNLSFSNSVTDADWAGINGDPHGTHGIADIMGATVANIDNTTIGVSTDALMEGMGVTLNFITLSNDASGDDIGSEIDLILDFSCGQLGYASFSADDAGFTDTDYVYWQSSYDF